MFRLTASCVSSYVVTCSLSVSIPLRVVLQLITILVHSLLVLEEYLLELAQGIGRVSYRMTDRARVRVDLEVVSALSHHQQPCIRKKKRRRRTTRLVRLVAEEMDLLEFLILDVIQTECFVPSVREDVEGNLTTDRESQAIVLKFFL